MAFKATAYSTKLVRKKQGSRTFSRPPAPTPYAHNATQIDFIEMDYAIYQTAPPFNVGYAETVLIDSLRNHQKLILSGQ